MPYISPEAVQRVKQIDLLTYLRQCEPHELVRFSGHTYTTKTHGSSKISNGKWMWWGKGIGGKSALDYLIKVREMDFLTAVECLSGQLGISEVQAPVSIPAEKEKVKKLLLPPMNSSHKHVETCLLGRDIDEEIIQYCMEHKMIYESTSYQNAVFVGFDHQNVPRYAAIRGTKSDFIGEANGSNKNYSFAIPAEKTNKTLHLFESATDLLSYATLWKISGVSWRREHLLSLAGIYQPAKNLESSKVPMALNRYLNEHPEIKKMIFHLDNDTPVRS